MIDVHEQVLIDLKRDEGERLTPYDDATGRPLMKGDALQGNITIGVGVNLSAGISDDESHLLLSGRLKRIMVELNHEYSWWVKCPEPVQCGILNMAYNVGVPRLGTFKRMLSCLQAGDYDGAAREALESHWANQVGERATRIADLFRSCATHTGVAA